MEIDSLLERRYRVLGRNSPLFYDQPLHLVRGEGVWLYDADGRRYLDAYNNVPHVGHCHPRVVAALSRQAATLNIHTRYLDENVVAYAERLTSLFDPQLSMAMFCCTGSEANELALRIARDCSGGSGIISTAWAYHGNTEAVMQVSSLFTPEDKRGPNVRTVPVMDPYRDRAGRSDEELATAYAGEVKRAIDSFTAAGIRFAGLLYCTAFSSEGLPTVPAGFMAKALAHVHAAGGYFIADEVQAGFGRLGSHMWGHQKLGVIPDIVTMGKPMGNGHPLAAVVARRGLVSAFTGRNMYFNTFGGNPVSAAVGMAVLDVIEDEHLLENAVTVGGYTLAKLEKLADRHRLIGDVRGAGLFFAVELVSDHKAKVPATAQTKRLVNLMRERGVLISRIGMHDNILKIRPPMPFSKEHADLLVDTLGQALAAL
ncbi:MAG TPA: aminotransferase class III-fold pyridoxal phosphate-dependent enzyme [Steroidobacteraceae bacterium]|jgi:4-aminobutyrate aminotransferase-like enzyme|nr:aminotransferase class III-fold pyridoxal phosphate-dependent enzyme [Steroidobacteraceae bacterium]